MLQHKFYIKIQLLFFIVLSALLFLTTEAYAIRINAQETNNGYERLDDYNLLGVPCRAIATFGFQVTADDRDILFPINSGNCINDVDIVAELNKEKYPYITTASYRYDCTTGEYIFLPAEKHFFAEKTYCWSDAERDGENYIIRQGETAIVKVYVLTNDYDKEYFVRTIIDGFKWKDRTGKSYISSLKASTFEMKLGRSNCSNITSIFPDDARCFKNYEQSCSSDSDCTETKGACVSYSSSVQNWQRQQVLNDLFCYRHINDSTCKCINSKCVWADEKDDVTIQKKAEQECEPPYTFDPKCYAGALSTIYGKESMYKCAKDKAFYINNGIILYNGSCLKYLVSKNGARYCERLELPDETSRDDDNRRCWTYTPGKNTSSISNRSETGSCSYITTPYRQKVLLYNPVNIICPAPGAYGSCDWMVYHSKSSDHQVHLYTVSPIPLQGVNFCPLSRPDRIPKGEGVYGQIGKGYRKESGPAFDQIARSNWQGKSMGEIIFTVKAEGGDVYIPTHHESRYYEKWIITYFEEGTLSFIGATNFDEKNVKIFARYFNTGTDKDGEELLFHADPYGRPQYYIVKDGTEAEIVLTLHGDIVSKYSGGIGDITFGSYELHGFYWRDGLWGKWYLMETRLTGDSFSQNIILEKDKMFSLQQGTDPKVYYSRDLKTYIDFCGINGENIVPKAMAEVTEYDLETAWINFYYNIKPGIASERWTNYARHLEPWQLIIAKNDFKLNDKTKKQLKDAGEYDTAYTQLKADGIDLEAKELIPVDSLPPNYFAKSVAKKLGLETPKFDPPLPPRECKTDDECAVEGEYQEICHDIDTPMDTTPHIGSGYKSCWPSEIPEIVYSKYSCRCEKVVPTDPYSKSICQWTTSSRPVLGECPMCVDNASPVCAEKNGTTQVFTNACYAKCYGAKIVANQKVEDGSCVSITAKDCQQYCDYGSWGTGSFVCGIRPDATISGSQYITWFVSKCYADCAQSKKQEDYIVENYQCKTPETLLDCSSCPTGAKVCGTNKKVYSSECEAACKEITVSDSLIVVNNQCMTQEEADEYYKTHDREEITEDTEYTSQDEEKSQVTYVTCSNEVKPVCGYIEGETSVGIFRNQCQATNAGAKTYALQMIINTLGTHCTQITGTAGWSPYTGCYNHPDPNYYRVCGEDGKTYRNACHAYAYGVWPASQGPCDGQENDLAKYMPKPREQVELEVRAQSQAATGQQQLCVLWDATLQTTVICGTKIPYTPPTQMTEEQIQEKVDEIIKGATSVQKPDWWDDSSDEQQEEVEIDCSTLTDEEKEFFSICLDSTAVKETETAEPKIKTLAYEKDMTMRGEVDLGSLKSINVGFKLLITDLINTSSRKKNYLDAGILSENGMFSLAMPSFVNSTHISYQAYAIYDGKYLIGGPTQEVIVTSGSASSNTGQTTSGNTTYTSSDTTSVTVKTVNIADAIATTLQYSSSNRYLAKGSVALNSASAANVGFKISYTPKTSGMTPYSSQKIVSVMTTNGQFSYEISKPNSGSWIICYRAFVASGDLDSSSTIIRTGKPVCFTTD